MSERLTSQERAREIVRGVEWAMGEENQQRLLGIITAALEAHAAGWKESAKDFRDACDLLTEERDRERARADRLDNALDALHSWQGLMSLLDEHWPEDVFPGRFESLDAEKAEAKGDGPRIVALIRWVNRERKRADEAEDRLAALHADDTGHMHRCARVNGKWQCHEKCAVARVRELELELASHKGISATYTEELHGKVNRLKRQLAKAQQTKTAEAISIFNEGWRAGRDAAAKRVRAHWAAVEGEGELIDAIRALEPPGGGE